MTEYYSAQHVFLRGGFAPGWIKVEGDSIAAAEPGLPPPGVSVKDYGEAAIFPSFVNTHTHTYLSLMRGTLDGLEVEEWLRRIYATIPAFGEEHAYIGAALSFAEMLSAGTTTVADFFYLNGRGNANVRAAIRAAHDLGIRLVMGRTFLDAEWGGPATQETVDVAVERFRELRDEFKDDPMVEISPAPHSIMGASRPMLEAAHALAHEYGTLWYMHVSYSPHDVRQVEELFRQRQIALLDKWGVLSDRLVSVHALYLDDDEVARLGNSGGRVSYNAAANLFFAKDILDVPRLWRAGIKVGLGTDAAAGNNSLNLISEVREAGLLQKCLSHDPRVMSLEQAIALGTSAGGDVLGLPVGRLEPGCKADFQVLDTLDYSLQPTRALASNIVSAMSHKAVKDVYCGGRQVVRDGRIALIDDLDLRRRIAKFTA